jgi:uncharacterized membrane protein
MRRIIVLLLLGCAFFILNSEAVLAASIQQAKPVVKAVFFWTPGCSSCREVLQNYIPKIIHDYKSVLEIRFVQLATTQEIDRFYAVAPQVGLTKDKMGLPMVLAGNQVLVGSREIPKSFTALVDQSLASGGTEYPDWLDFAQFVWTSDFAMVQAALTQSPESEPVVKFSGMTLAAVTLAGLLIILAIIIANMVRGFLGKTTFYTIQWNQTLIPILAMLGLGVAIYLSFVEITAVPAICGPVGDCNTVQKSQYAHIFGVLPVGLAGVGGYLAILAAWAWGKLRKDQVEAYIPAVLFGMTVFGTLYSIYLTYLEIYVIHAVCIWCITSAVVMGLLALICTPDAVNWIAGMEDES